MNILQQRRLEMGIGQREAAEKCSLSLKAYNHIENGISKPRNSTVAMIAKVMNVEPMQVAEIYSLAQNEKERSQ